MAPCRPAHSQSSKPLFRDVEIGVRDPDILEAQRLAPLAGCRRQARPNRARRTTRERLRGAWTWTKAYRIAASTPCPPPPFIFPIPMRDRSGGCAPCTDARRRHDRDAHGRSRAPARRRSCADACARSAGRVPSRARAIRWLNIIRFRAYTFITLIFIGSPIQANGKRRDLPIAFIAVRSASSSGPSASPAGCRARTSR